MGGQGDWNQSLEGGKRGPRGEGEWVQGFVSVTQRCNTTKLEGSKEREVVRMVGDQVRR